MFSGAPCRCLVSFLTKDHVLSSESPYFYEKLPGGRALHSPVKQTAVSKAATFGSARRRTQILLTPLFYSAILALVALFDGQAQIIFFHLILQRDWLLFTRLVRFVSRYHLTPGNPESIP
jgi:hypothetical protein